MKNELLFSGSLLAGSTNTYQSQFRSCSALYVKLSGMTDDDLKNVQIILSIKGKRSLPIIDSDAYALAQMSDLLAGVGYESGSDNFIRVALGKYILEEGEFLSLQVITMSAITSAIFALVDDVDSGRSLKIQSFRSISDYTSRKMLACYGFGIAGKTFTISGDDGYSIVGDVALLIAKANGIEVTTGVDIGYLFFDPSAQGKQITVRSSSASHIITIEEQDGQDGEGEIE